MGGAGVGVVSLAGAALALPSFVTSEFQSLYCVGRPKRCVLHVSAGRVTDLFVVYGCNGADEKLCLVEQLFTAVLLEAADVSSVQPVVTVVGWIGVCFCVWTLIQTTFARFCPSALAVSVGYSVLKKRLFSPHLAVGSWFDVGRWQARMDMPQTYIPLWPACWLEALDKSRGSLGSP